MNIWQILDIEETHDIETIKKAYVKKIKQYKPETNPTEFQLIRQAYEIAQQHAAGKAVDFVINNSDPELQKNSTGMNNQNTNRKILFLIFLCEA